MNPELIQKSNGASFGWCCSNCGRVFPHVDWAAKRAGLAAAPDLQRAHSAARGCCEPDVCGHLVDGKPCGRQCRCGWTVCDACRDREEVRRELARFEKAEKVTLAEYDGAFLYIDGLGDEGYIDVDELDDVLADREGERPTYAWGCEKMPPPSLCLEDEVTERALEDYHEGASECVDWDKVKEAQKLVDEALVAIVSYQRTLRRAVLLPPAPAEKEPS